MKPILLILFELDFMGSNDLDLLIYHLPKCINDISLSLLFSINILYFPNHAEIGVFIIRGTTASRADTVPNT